MSLCFRTFHLHPLNTPLRRLCFASASGLAPDSPGRLSAVLRTSFTARSLISRIQPHRVRVVSRHWTHQFYGLSIHFQLLSTSPRGDAVTFGYWRLAPPERDFHPLAHTHSQAHERGHLGRSGFGPSARSGLPLKARQSRGRCGREGRTPPSRRRAVKNGEHTRPRVF